jgi:hypothetical protein
MNRPQITIHSSLEFVKIRTRLSENHYETHIARIPGTQFLGIFQLDKPIVRTDEGNWTFSDGVWEQIPGNIVWFIQIPVGEFGLTADDEIRLANGSPRINNPHHEDVYMFSDEGIVSVKGHSVITEYQGIHEFDLTFEPKLVRPWGRREFIVAGGNKAQVLYGSEWGAVMEFEDDIEGIDNGCAYLSNGKCIRILAF